MTALAPFDAPPAFRGENLLAWWKDAPGVCLYAPHRGPLLGADCAVIASRFDIGGLQAKFPRATQFHFLHQFANVTGYESDARVTMTRLGQSIPKAAFGAALIELGDATPTLIRMGLNTATVALAVMGRKLEVIPSLEDYIAEHGIGAVADDGICR